jgi:hypothetical protein
MTEVKDDVEKILKVIESPEHTWLAPFYVHSLLRGPPEQLTETIVKTVDIYTYFCPRCEKVDACLHTNAVRNHVIECMDRFYEQRNSEKNNKFN